MFPENQEERRCDNCRTRLDLGAEFIAVEEGVIGKNGPVPLEPTRMFCCSTCLTEYYADNGDNADADSYEAAGSAD